MRANQLEEKVDNGVGCNPQKAGCCNKHKTWAKPHGVSSKHPYVVAGEMESKTLLEHTANCVVVSLLKVADGNGGLGGCH